MPWLGSGRAGHAGASAGASSAVDRALESVSQALRDTVRVRAEAEARVREAEARAREAAGGPRPGARSRLVVLPELDLVEDAERVPLLEFASQLAQAAPLLGRMPGAQALRAALLTVVLQALAPVPAGSGRRPVALEEVGDGLDIVVRVGDLGGDGDAGGDEETGAETVPGEGHPAASVPGVAADGHDDVTQGPVVPAGVVGLPGVDDLQGGHDDSSSVGGDGAVGGDPALSGSGASEPTEEAPVVVRDPLTGRVTGTRGPVTSSRIAVERVVRNRCRLSWGLDESGEAVPVEAVWEYDVGSPADGAPSSPSGAGGGAGTPAAGEATVGDPVSGEGEGSGVSPSPGCP